MGWRVYEVVLQLQTPMHIGWRRTGNLQMTRPYVTGRVLWGALAARLTRNRAVAEGLHPVRNDYEQVEKAVNEHLRFTYFYPALMGGANISGDYEIQWPWMRKDRFRYRILGGYASTALEHSQRAAEEGTLHEVEYISPRIRDNASPVFLLGYVFEKDGNKIRWSDTLDGLQLGGERGYGWGLVSLSKVEDLSRSGSVDGKPLFEGKIHIKSLGNNSPVVTVGKGERILAHAHTDGVSARGNIEPLVGHRWVSGEPNRASYQKIAFSAVCYAPGALLEETTNFEVVEDGLWKRLP